MEASVVIDKVRGILSDTQAQPRWSTSRLLSILDDCLLHMATTTTIFNSRAYLKLLTTTQDYDLSDTVLRLLRVEYESEALIVTTHTSMDNLFADWRTNTGVKPERIIYDLVNPGKFTIYPITDTVGDTRNISTNSLFGIIDTLVYLPYKPTLDEEDVYGALDLEEKHNYIKIFYTKRLSSVTDTSEILDTSIDTTLLSYIVYYIASFALRDNNDESISVKANIYYNLYNQGLSDYTQNIKAITRDDRTTGYRGFI